MPNNSNYHAATLLARHNRFVVSVQWPDGSVTPAHCPNTGSLKTVLAPPQPCWVQATPHNKLPHRVVALQTGGTWVGIYPLLANTLVAKALAQGALAPFSDYNHAQAEVPYLPGHRADFCLTAATGRRCWVEAKSVSMATDSIAQFPDSVSARATKHLHGLIEMVKRGDAASVIFVVQRADCQHFSPAAGLDPAFATALGQAIAAGVTVYAYSCQVTQKGIALHQPLAVKV